jgi:hypothetical protein
MGTKFMVHISEIGYEDGQLMELVLSSGGLIIHE